MRSLQIYFLIILIQNTLNLTAQNCTYEVEGNIYDLNTRMPIPYVTVQIEGTQNGNVADDSGFFKINNICQSEFNLSISHVGYHKTVHHHDIYHESPKIYLASDEFVLESVVIEGQKPTGDLTSTTSTLIKAEDLEVVQSGSFGDVAGSIAGISTISTGQNIVKPVLHGLHSNRILIINNGIRHEFQNWGVEHAPEIDPSLADNLEVIKGAATVRYGADALGGVILINPPKIELSEHLHGEIKLAGNSNGRSGESTIKLQKGFNRFGLLAEASLLKQGDLRAPDYNLSNTGKNELSFATGANYHLSNIDIELYYSHFSQELGILRGSVVGDLNDLDGAISNEPPQNTRSFSYRIKTPRQEVDHDLVKLKGAYLKENQSFNFQYGYQVNRRMEFDIRRGSNNDAPSISLQLISHSLDLDWNHPQINNLNGIIGIQTLYQDNNNLPGTNTISFIPNFNNSRFGIFIIESMERGMNTFEAGIRYDYQYSSVRGRDTDNSIFRNELDFQNITATLGLNHEFSSNATFRTNFGSAWRPPSVVDLYRLGKNEFINETGLLRFEYDENHNINTKLVSTIEKSTPNEFGLKWVNSFEKYNDRYNLDITVYSNYVFNYIYSRPAGITNTVRGPFPFFVFEQTDALLWGVDLNLFWKHSGVISSLVRGSYLWSKDVSNNDFFVGQPPSNLQYELSFKPKLEFFDETKISVSLYYSFKQYQAPKRIVSLGQILEAQSKGEDLFSEDTSNFDFLKEPEGYFLTNISFRSTIRKFTLLLQAKNMLNVDYRSYTNRLRYFADETGRNIGLSFIYRI
ncbi:MAG: TonB-dependent receptor [Bacteroidetes bacterium]|nr:TonB-dependent receptor [Bacteroidota bacterium]MDA1119449.1 TonB-dependent receptor [Bacteroidota bacterium]